MKQVLVQKQHVKAINPILATIFLIIITIVIAALFYMWTTGAFGQQMRVTQLMVKDKKFIESQSKIVVEIVLRNAGSTDVTVISASLVDPNTQEVIGELSTEAGVVTLKPGDEVTFNGFFDKSQLVRGETYLISIQYKVGSQLNTMTVEIQYISTL